MSIAGVTLTCLVVSFIWNILFWDRTYGISMPVFSVIVISLLLWHKKTSLSKAGGTLFVHLFLLMYLSICVCCYRNDLIFYATIPAVYLGLCAVAFMGQEGYSFANFVGVVESLVMRILSAVFAVPDAFGKTIGKMSGNVKGSRTAFKVAVGMIISIPFLAIFTGLFTSADPIFRMNVEDFLEFIWRPEIIRRVVVIVLMWVFLAGYVVRNSKFSSVQSQLNKVEQKRNFDGIVTFVFLTMINLLFVSFIVIQLEYLFGGESLVRNTSFTYAEYAHKGFYEFWAAVILVSVIILYTDYKLKEQPGAICRMVKYAWVAMIAQTFVIIASGLKRIFVYEEAYGYTYLRILVALFLLWVAGSFLLFVYKIMRKKSIAWLISSGICLAFLFLGFVSTFSIDRYIARKNIDRYLNHGRRLDMEYLSTLSTDTYPEILRLKMQAEDDHIRQSAEGILRQQYETAQENLRHWASWNRSLSQVEKQN